MSKNKIYITDDHTILRDGLKAILANKPGYEVIGESGNGEDTLREIKELKPDVILLDISLPTMSGVEVCRRIKKDYPKIKIIILSRHDNEIYIKQLLKLGISGYVLKENAVNDLYRAIDAAVKGNIFLSPRINRNIILEYVTNKNKQDNFDVNKMADILTNQEKTILKLIAEGKTHKEIAKLLFISIMTIKKHRANIIKKLNIHNTAGLVIFAIKNGLKEI